MLISIDNKSKLSIQRFIAVEDIYKNQDLVDTQSLHMYIVYILLINLIVFDISVYTFGCGVEYSQKDTNVNQINYVFTKSELQFS